MISKKKIKAFQEGILSWYEKHKRDLPWRRTRDPYKILVSEVMLQQTQVLRVIPKYKAWFVAFPTVESLAAAKTSDVLRLWSGLGYNRRALNLQKAAKIVVDTSGGKFPADEKSLLSLPGIGEYTARAVLSFAFNKQVAVVDTNVRKVILTQLAHCHCEESKKTTKQSHQKDCRASLPPEVGAGAMTSKELQEIADQLLPKGRAREWNQALMDYASLELKDKKISAPKQSTFMNSHRYYRGQIIKILIEEQVVSLIKLMEKLQKDQEFVAKILQELQDEGFLLYENDRAQLR